MRSRTWCLRASPISRFLPDTLNVMPSSRSAFSPRGRASSGDAGQIMILAAGKTSLAAEVSRGFEAPPPPALRRGGDAKRLPVLRHGAAGDLDPFGLQGLGDCLVGEH